jgi:3-isopropylmalate dehydrogenase
MALLLDHLGRGEDARRIEAAVDADIVERGTAQRPTSVVGDDIAARLR